MSPLVQGAGAAWRLLMSALLVSACASSPPRLNEDQQFKAVLDLMECDECYNRQLEFVIDMGLQLEPMLRHAQNTTGPFADVLASKRSFYEEQATRIADRQAVPEGTDRNIWRAAYVDQFIRGDERRYRNRASVALERLRNALPERVR